MFVKAKAANIKICIIIGYGPQETWEDNYILPFYNAFEKEIASAQLEGKSIIIAMDSNAKLVVKHIPNYPTTITRNINILAKITERYA